MSTYDPCLPDGDIERMIEAEPFSKGTARHAYSLKSDPNAIVKKSIRSRNYSNILEWTIWLGAENHPELASVLGRCYCLSETGLYLIMERLDDIVKEDYALVPDIPAWCNDGKPDAFGKRDRVIKVRDYGMVRFDELLNRTKVKPPAFALNARTNALMNKRGESD